MDIHHNNKTLREKRWLRMQRERARLASEAELRSGPGYPGRTGWKRQFVLTDEAACRADAAVLRAILKQIIVIEYSVREDFSDLPVRRHWLAGPCGPVSRAVQPRLQLVSVSGWTHRKWPVAWKRFFGPAPRWLWKSPERPLLKFCIPGVFVLRTGPHCFWRFPPGLAGVPDIESQLKRLDNKAQAGGAWPRISRLYGKRNRWDEGEGLRERISRCSCREQLRGLEVRPLRVSTVLRAAA